MFKAMNGIDNAAQVWNKHFHSFMMKENFVRISRDDCIYVHPTTSIQSCLYVDDILASADPDKNQELDQFVKRVQTQFLVRIFGEPKKFLGMEISYMWEQGICCIPQQSYIEKLAKNFLTEHDAQFPAYPTTPMDMHVFDKLEKQMTSQILKDHIEA